MKLPAIAPGMVKNETTENSISADLFDLVAKAQAIKRTGATGRLGGYTFLSRIRRHSIYYGSNYSS